MKGKFSQRHSRGVNIDAKEADAIAVELFECIAADPDRLGRFLTLTGLDPAQIRAAAASPAFLPAVIDYVASDEGLLVTLAGEIGRTPDIVARARMRLSPEATDEP